MNHLPNRLVRETPADRECLISAARGEMWNHVPSSYIRYIETVVLRPQMRMPSKSRERRTADAMSAGSYAETVLAIEYRCRECTELSSLLALASQSQELSTYGR